MLYVYINDGRGNLPDEYESYVSDYFDDVYEPEWFNDSYVQKIIREIDDSQVEVRAGKSVNIYNEYLGNIPPSHLSSGTKGLILLYKDDVKINGDRLGDNCIGFLLEIADKKDISIALSHTPPFPDKFEAVIVNNGEHISTKTEFVSWKVRYTYGDD
jgi:hypothetical protein